MAKSSSNSYSQSTPLLSGGVTYNNYQNNNSTKSASDYLPSVNYNTANTLASSFGSAGGGTPWGTIAGAGQNVYNGISGKTSDDYSDTEESVIYPLKGAAMGSALGPYGTLGGALYGLGYSFKDDLGLDDDNFFGKLLFPIEM